MDLSPTPTITEKARQFAEVYHAKQVRKGTGEPYTRHLEEVVQILDEAGIDDVETRILAWLHDVVEDTDATFTDLHQTFGRHTSINVWWLTDTPKEFGNREIRKLIDAERMSKAPNACKAVKLADMISNMKTIVKYDRDFARVYLNEKDHLLHCLSKGLPSPYSRVNKLWQQAFDVWAKAKMELENGEH